jgi:hypothetical protein
MVGKPEGEKLFGGSRSRWEDNIKKGLRETMMESMVWTHLAQGIDQWQALINTVINLREENFMTS